MFLMDMTLNPALEVQAVGRVHRMGQTREVHVKRLVMKDSVEQRILGLHRAAVAIGSKVPEREPAVAGGSAVGDAATGSCSGAGAGAGDASTDVQQSDKVGCWCDGRARTGCCVLCAVPARCALGWLIALQDCHTRLSLSSQLAQYCP